MIQIGGTKHHRFDSYNRRCCASGCRHWASPKQESETFGALVGGRRHSRLYGSMAFDRGHGMGYLMNPVVSF